MKLFFKTYKSSIILLCSIVLGGAIGIIFGTKTSILKPFGDLFLNLMFMIIVPLVFFNVTSAIANMNGMKRLAKIMGSIVIVFFSTALVAAIIGLIGALIINPTKGIDYSIIKKVITEIPSSSQKLKHLGALQQFVNTVTVTDFVGLFSKNNMLQLILFSILFGISTAMLGEKGEPVAKFLESASNIVMNMVKIIMYYAPIGLGCYFAAIIGELGPQILQGYLRVFILYIILTVIYYLAFFTFYAFLANGKDGVKTFWKNALPPTITSLATCSSAACIPINLEAAKKMGVPEDIAETVIPLGANIHKDGSVFGGIMKIIFLFGLFGKNLNSISTLLGIILVAFLVGAVMGAIPGGGMIGEMLILSVYGFPPECLPIIAVISTIIDAPATVLNSTGNTVCAMMVTRMVEGKEYIENSLRM
ncbi:dicarboxylate/amino acid:cation symporter [Clostridium sp. P21]|uniref:Dicarboxylate/amino acid:cation symporter n=1 Tax=Clostridium muellerianum TaxID=2716538 RepID=A0A7Y0EF72_9CLOT|nr:dicarboxylate/amino acid:cation symporter [Clostridium muellerianum]NMM62317.1 dicarboxylate/amino acid:cation symporter [Clostridium muellerianum]